MRSPILQNGEEQYQCHQQSEQYVKNPEERMHRYEHLKNSVAVLRSRFRSTSTASPRIPSSPSPVHNTDLVPYSNYFSFAGGACASARDRSSRPNCSVNQIEACSLLESYAMQALRLDCETQMRAGREELERVREKLKDKSRRTEMFDRDLEKQRRKLEGRLEFFSERAKTLERQLAEQSVRHDEELLAQSEVFAASREQDKEEREQETQKTISNYGELRETNERQLAEIQRLKEELSNRLEQMEKNKLTTEDRLKYLDGQLKLVVQQSETFRMSYEEQEREWNLKLQHITAMHQNQTKVLYEDFEFQIEKLRKEMKEERDEQTLKLQAYKAQKLLDMKIVEQRFKEVLEMKDLTITNLKLELKMLHHHFYESVNMLDDDCNTGSFVEPL